MKAALELIRETGLLFSYADKRRLEEGDLDGTLREVAKWERKLRRLVVFNAVVAGLLTAMITFGGEAYRWWWGLLMLSIAVNLGLSTYRFGQARMLRRAVEVLAGQRAEPAESPGESDGARSASPA